MTKSEFISAVSKKTGLSKASTGVFLDAFMDVVKDELKSGGSVDFIGFGKFYSTERGSKVGKNPRTGEAVKIPAARVPKFHPGKPFKEYVNGGKN